jgi:tetratricopeptide (TPR) repeat protein
MPNIQYGWASLYSLTTNEYKYIEAPRAELYSLKEDPREDHNILRKHPKKGRSMKKSLQIIIERISQEAPQVKAADLDELTLKKLAALGYIGSPVKAKKRRFPSDPKDKFPVFNAISKVSELIDNENYIAAIPALKEIEQTERDNPQIHLQLAQCYQKIHDLKNARLYLDKILKDDPNNLKALIFMAELLVEDGNVEDMITICKKSISVDKDCTQALSMLGYANFQKKRFLPALNYFNRVLKIQPKITRNQLNLAKCLIELRKFENVESILLKIIKDQPHFPQVNFLLGLYYNETDHNDKALIHYRREFEKYPESVPARFNYARIIFSTGNLEEYLYQMNKIVEIDPYFSKAYLFLARGLLRKGEDMNGIKSLIKKGLELAKDAKTKTLAYYLYADVFNREKNNKMLAEVLKKAKYYEQKGANQ